MSRANILSLTAFFLILAFGLTVVTIAHAELGDHAGLKARIAKRLLEREKTEAVAPVPITKPGDYTFTIPFGDGKRSYMVHVPPTYTPQRATPVVMAFHGGGGSMEYMAKDKYYGLNTKSDAAGFVVVYPNGTGAIRADGNLATWNAGACCGGARDQNIDDVGYVRQILINLNRQLNIDNNRIFATGMSNGGMMSHRLACEMADTFAAIAPVAGTDNTLSCNPSRPVSVIEFHALNDTHVLFNGGAGKDAFRDVSKVTDFTSAPETISRWVKRNQCTGTPRRVKTVPGAYCDLYDICADGARVQLCVTETGGHSWPGGHKPAGRATEPPSQAISANDEMWSFFMAGP